MFKGKKVKSQYAVENEQWLLAKAQEDGVMELQQGIYYKVLKSGSGRSVTNLNNVISCHYTGRTIDGKCFDTSEGGYPLACRLRDLIQGWIIAIPKMKVGDKWEIYIPASLGYGKIAQPGIPAWSTLIFEIELLGVQ